MVGQYPTIADTYLADVVRVPGPSFVAAQVNNLLMVYPLEIFVFVRAVTGYSVRPWTVARPSSSAAGKASFPFRTNSARQG